MVELGYHVEVKDVKAKYHEPAYILSRINNEKIRLPLTFKTLNFLIDFCTTANKKYLSLIKPLGYEAKMKVNTQGCVYPNADKCNTLTVSSDTKSVSITYNNNIIAPFELEDLHRFKYLLEKILSYKNKYKNNPNMSNFVLGGEFKVKF